MRVKSVLMIIGHKTVIPKYTGYGPYYTLTANMFKFSKLRFSEHWPKEMCCHLVVLLYNRFMWLFCFVSITTDIYLVWHVKFDILNQIVVQLSNEFPNCCRRWLARFSSAEGVCYRTIQSHRRLLQPPSSHLLCRYVTCAKKHTAKLSSWGWCTQWKRYKIGISVWSWTNI